MEIAFDEEMFLSYHDVKIRPFRYGNTDEIKKLIIELLELKSDRFGMEIKIR